MVRTAVVVVVLLIQVAACGADTAGSLGGDSDEAGSPPSARDDAPRRQDPQDPQDPQDGQDPQGERADAPLLTGPAGRLQQTAHERWPDSFAGLWLSEGGDAVTIAFTEGAKSKVERLSRDFPRPDALRAVTRECSLAELESLQERMGADRELARAGKFSLPGVPGHRYDLGIDIKRNAVLVFLARPTAQTVAVFRDRYGEHIIVEQGLARPDA